MCCFTQTIVNHIIRTITKSMKHLHITTGHTMNLLIFYDKPFIFVNLLIFFCYIRSAQQHPSGQFDDWPDFQRQIIGNTPVCQGLATPDLQKVPTFPQIHIFLVRNFRKKQVNLYCDKTS